MRSLLLSTPPMARKIFLLAATSFELRCQCPMVTPASLGAYGCAKAVPAARLETRHKAEIEINVLIAGTSQLSSHSTVRSGGILAPGRHARKCADSRFMM